MNARASGNASQRPAPFTESAVLLLAAKRKPPILLRSLGNRSPARCRPRAGDRDHDAFALGVLSSKSQKGRALLHAGHGRDRTPTCDLWHVRVVVLVMPTKVETNLWHTRPKSVVRTRVVSCSWWTSRSRWKTRLAAARLAERRPRSWRRYSTSSFTICASVAPSRTLFTTTFMSVCWATAKTAVNRRSAVN